MSDRERIRLTSLADAESRDLPPREVGEIVGGNLIEIAL